MNGKYKKLLGVREIYIRDDDIVIIGQPADSEDDNHNCDVMGCSSMEHILLRGQFRFVQKGYSEDAQESEDE